MGSAKRMPSMVILEAPYETTDPTVDSQIVGMKSAGCDVFTNFSIPKFAAQAIRKVAEIDWHPLHVLASVSNLGRRRRSKARRPGKRQGRRLRSIPERSHRPDLEG